MGDADFLIVMLCLLSKNIQNNFQNPLVLKKSNLPVGSIRISGGFC